MKGSLSARRREVKRPARKPSVMLPEGDRNSLFR
jgi:hypothetical protein